MNKFSKKFGIAIAICVTVGLVLVLSSSVSALRRIDNRVSVDAPTIVSEGSGMLSSSSGNYYFEKGDAIYKRLDVSVIIAAVEKGVEDD